MIFFFPDNVVEVAKPKGKAGPKKAPAKKGKSSSVLRDEDDEDDDEVLALKDRLAAYNLGSSSPDQSETMETEIPKREPSKRATSKKPLSSVTEISDDNDQIEISDDEDFELEVEAVPKEKGRKKAANSKAANKPAPATKKRGQANKTSQLVGQKLITEVLKPADVSKISPEKKVRRMRPSPFNKKSGSVLERLSHQENDKMSPESEEQESPASNTSGSTEESAQLVVPRARPQRGGNRGKAKYVLSDSENDEVTDDSDFNEDDD